MRIRNEVAILFLFLFCTVHTCNHSAHGHDTHVSDKPWTAPIEWVTTTKIKDAAGVCWHVYKECEPNTICNNQLHIEEIDCHENP